jgi:hypothetical protein
MMLMKTFCCILPWLLIAPLWGQQAPGQDTAQPGQTPAPQVQSPTQSANRSISNPNSSQKQTGKTSRDRLFYTLPNFLTVEDEAHAKPLSAGDKFKVTTQESFDPAVLGFYGFLAGMSQWQNSEKGYGQGAAGYAKRYGQQFGDGTIQNYMAKAVFPSIFHQDPRYFQLGKGGFFRRTRYALSRVLITRSDSGKKQFNYSEILGTASAAAISDYTYHPRSDRGLANVAGIWGTQLGWDAAGYVLREFWPDIRNKLRRATGHAH